MKRQLLRIGIGARCAACNRTFTYFAPLRRTFRREDGTIRLAPNSISISPSSISPLLRRRCSTKAEESVLYGVVTLRYERGLPVLSVPLPSRRELCQFSLKPVSDTVHNLCQYLVAEDKGIDFVAVYSTDGTRIAGSTSIEHLLQFGDFRLRINDLAYEVCVPSTQDGITSLVELTSDKFRCIDDMKATIASLHAIFNVDEFKVSREKQLVEKLEEIQLELKPLEAVKLKIDRECEKHSERVMWSFFVAMGLQMGVFARLTWWEYSWDIMEPVTYFATYATVIATYGYYLYTRQDFEYTLMRNRCYTKYFYKIAQKYKFDVEKYNELLELSEGIRKDLNRLRDPLYQHLPATHLAWVLNENKRKSAAATKSVSATSFEGAGVDGDDDMR